MQGKQFTPKETSAGRFMGYHKIVRPEGGVDLDYMTRIWFGRLRIHVFHRGDHDEDCHDHPWDFWTFPLTSYVEEVSEPIRETVAEWPIIERVQTGFDRDGQPEFLEHMTMGGPTPRPPRFYKRRQIVKAWRWTFRPAEHCHRVLGPSSGYYGGQSAHNLEPTVKPGKIVTIVWRGTPRRKWGFLKNRDGKWCWVGWKDYVFNGGKSAPCGD